MGSQPTWGTFSRSPVCVAGGLRSVEDVRHILSMGADKAAINTAGFVLLMGFMLLVTFQDVFKLVK